MTKVKTILAEFCSPKDILAINRLGLLKKEERESQPIPWRHRLNNRERRELVRSELRTSIRPSSHTGRKEHTRAINSAKCPKDSRMGECLISSHTKSSSILAPRLGRISSEQHRTECRLQQHKKNFLRNSTCLNHEPLILVERPATPKVKSRAAFMKKHGIDPVVVEVPRYMRPTQSRARTPSTLTTIEAFAVDAKKKKNIWEEAVDDKDDLKFKSTYKSSAALTNAEIKMLRIGHSLHKPTEESIRRVKSPDDDACADEDEGSPPPRCVSGKKKILKSKPDPVQRPETVVGGSIFITQMSQSNTQYGGSSVNKNKGSNKLKSVTFSDFGNTQITKPKKERRESAKDMLVAERNGRAMLRKSGRQESSQAFQEVSIATRKSIATTKPAPMNRSKSKPFLSLVLQT